MGMGLSHKSLCLLGGMGSAVAALLVFSRARVALAEPVQSATSSAISSPTASLGTRQPRNRLADIATIAEADVVDVTSAYDDRLGPRIVVSLSNVVIHAGSALPETTFSQLGGPLPSGKYIEVDHLTRFAVGSRYIFFFATQASVYTAVWARLAFRIEKLASKSIVLGPDGYVVRRFGVDGVQFGRSKLIAESTEHSLTGGAFDRTAAESDADVASAIAPEDFVASAQQATSAVGAPIGAEISLRPRDTDRWDVIPTSPQ
jgi:hypothetical protein